MNATRTICLLVAVSTMFTGCGGGSMAARTPTGISVQSSPANQTAYSSLPSPQNQVSFAAYITYSDGTQSTTPITKVQWADQDNWVTLSGGVATCIQPAPVVILPAFSTVTATAQVNGTTYTSTSGVYCL